MQLKLYSPPSIEPVSLQDMKEHLRLDSGAFTDNLTPTQLIAPGSHAVSTAYTLLETLTLDVAPGGAGWAAGDTITGAGGKTCKIVEVLTTKTYTIWNRSGNFTLGEILSNGTATADQGAAFPVVTRPYADVLGYSAVVVLDSGINLATGTVDAKIQESDDHIAWNDWTGGAFTQVTTANDGAIQKIAYTGAKQYISVISKVLLAACEFGISVSKYASDTTEDTILAALITAAREQVEAILQRQLITATWDAFLDEFPDYDERCPFIRLPFGNLQSVTSVAYTDSDGTVTTMDVTDDYLVDDDSDPGRIVLPYGISWPSFTAHPVNPVAIRFVCGYGATAADVPSGIRVAIKMLCEDLYNLRSAQHNLPAGSVTENKAVMALLYPFRLWQF